MSIFTDLLTCRSLAFLPASCTLWSPHVPLYCPSHLSSIRFPTILTQPLRLTCPSLLSFSLVPLSLSCQPHVPSDAHMSIFSVFLTCPSFTFLLASCTLWCSNVPLYCLTHLSVIRLPNSLTFPLRLRCPSLLSFTLVLLLLLYQPHTPSEARFFIFTDHLTCPSFTSLPASYTLWSLHVPL